ncbi:MAG: single-stranded DNA-binding protein [Peptoclostridium sp.]|uniref:single-stranded DNA-binding protein n=1 Tax=Peptoclostridium sp. TaxID=1904860 RepID=UPI00139F00A7|nr:single-stranded DNA-binding protein [Peptoclostridium sp.]MZQ74759.1 single-stranded DNA-binding protein [Peptoclostridium sp.]
MNCVILIGRLTKDPDLRYIPGTGNPVATFTVAVNRTFKNKEGNYEADFIPVQVWGKQAENCANYLQKGRQVGVSGRLQVRSYETQNGERRWVTEVVADRIEFLEWSSKESGSGSSEAPRSFEPTGLDPEGFQALDDDDIPF